MPPDHDGLTVVEEALYRVGLPPPGLRRVLSKKEKEDAQGTETKEKIPVERTA